MVNLHNYGYSILWLKDKIFKTNRSDNVSKVRKNLFLSRWEQQNLVTFRLITFRRKHLIHIFDKKMFNASDLVYYNNVIYYKSYTLLIF